MSYRRIPTGLPYTDPFSGTYLAAFGPHGVEMLLLTRAVGKGGHEIVTARKLTGAEAACWTAAAVEISSCKFGAASCVPLSLCRTC